MPPKEKLTPDQQRTDKFMVHQQHAEHWWLSLVCNVKIKNDRSELGELVNGNDLTFTKMYFTKKY